MLKSHTFAATSLMSADSSPSPSCAVLSGWALSMLLILAGVGLLMRKAPGSTTKITKELKGACAPLGPFRSPLPSLLSSFSTQLEP